MMCRTSIACAHLLTSASDGWGLPKRKQPYHIEAVAGHEVDDVQVSVEGAGGGNVAVALIGPVGGLRQQWGDLGCG